MNTSTTLSICSIGMGYEVSASELLFSLQDRAKKVGFGIAFSIACAWFLFPTRAVAAERWETLQAIHMIENPNNSTRVGRNGELGPYQFRPSTWRMHTKKSFQLATDRAEADRVAVLHYEWIKHGLERGGVEATTYRIALAWNAGLDATLRGAAPSSSRGYATRVDSIAGELERQQVAREP